MKSFDFGRLLVYVLLILGALFTILPFIWLLRSSIMDNFQVLAYPPQWIPHPVVLSTFERALTTLPFGRYYINSFIIVTGAVLGACVSSSLGAYGFSRFTWPGRNLVFGILLSSMMLPYAVTMIPLFLEWKWVGGLNTFFPLITPEWFGVPAFFIFLMRQFYMTLPKDLDEAAIIDGAGYFRIFWSILLPLTKPALFVVALFSFLGNWNDFLRPLIYLTDSNMFTVAVGLSEFIGLYSSQWNLLMAAATVATVPAILVFAFGQRQLVEGIQLTGVKG